MTNLSQCSDIMLPIPGYEGLYLAHRYGFIISCKKERILSNNGLWGKEVTCMVPIDNNHGYDQVKLAKEGVVKTFKVHRLIAITFIPNPLQLPQVNHIDGNKKNNQLINLEWCTCKQNRDHALQNGLRVETFKGWLGSDSPVAKFTKAQIICIRSGNEKTKTLSDRFGVTRSCINAIKRRASYRDV